MNPIRLLTAREIECRVAQIKKNGLQLLLYKNSRADMAILDETFGPMNWQRHHSRDNANCTVSIWDGEKKQWIDKEDTGTESNTEAEKGLASDSFKRACVNVGIGRELYTSPYIWVTSANCEIKETPQGRLACYDRFDVAEIGYNEHREINRLVIINSKTHNPVYEFGTASSEPQKGPSKRPTRIADKEPAEPVKAAERGKRGAVAKAHEQMATVEQIEYIKTNASDEDYENLMITYGPELETMTANQAAAAILNIDQHNANREKAMITCERCGKIITGVALPDGTTMAAGEIIGKSKLAYNGVYCWSCCAELKKAKSTKKAG